MATCTDHANNFYLDGALCQECASECGTCSGPLNSNCDSCAISHYEIVGHPSASPMHCLSSCPSFYFDQGWQCKCKSLALISACLANCEVCNDAVTCTTCESGYFYLGTACTNPCPSQRYYPNSSSRVCESCSDSNCLDCRSVDKDTCFQCDVSARYYLSSSSCDYCPSPDVVTDTDCIACTMPGYYITQ